MTAVSEQPETIANAKPLEGERYRYVERLDEHRSAAEVWLVHDTRLDSPAILKRYVLGKEARTQAIRYGVERDVLARQVHGLPRLRDNFQSADGALIIVRDYIPGHSLRRTVEEEQRLDIVRAAGICRSAATIAHALHTQPSRPLAMADIHGANFVVEGDSTVWWVEPAGALPITDGVASAPTLLLPYAQQAPEQAKGATIATDIWGLGGLLYFCLTGRMTPVQGGQSVVDGYREVEPNPSEQVVEVLLRACAYDPADRFESAEDLAIALSSLERLRVTSIPLERRKLPPLAVHRIELAESRVAHALRSGEPGSLAWARLADQASLLRGTVHSDDLTTLSTLEIMPYEHQIRAVRRVINNPSMSGGAILADEVGLGKTIEAMLIFQELRARGLAETALVIAPPQGVTTWAEEFHMRMRVGRNEHTFRVYDGLQDAGYPMLIVSSATLRQTRHREAIAAYPYDVVVVDEAHTMSGADGRPNAHGRRAVMSLTRRRTFLLTATPVRRRLRELYTLVTMIRPGFLGNMADFVTRFETPTEQGEIERRALRAILESIMIRQRRRDLTDISFPERVYRTLKYSPSRRDRHGFAARVNVLAEYLGCLQQGRRALVFLSDTAERTELAASLAKHLHGRPIMHFGGDRDERRRLTVAFQHTPSAIMLAGDGGSEGMNWQTADVVVHADIPWDPSAWEQRVGRVYRLGQRARCVEIVHLLIPGSRDEAVLDLLRDDLGLFELAVGETASLLDHMPDPADRNVRTRLESAFRHAGVRSGSRSLHRAEAALDSYRAAIAYGRSQYNETCEQSDALDEIFGLST